MNVPDLAHAIPLGLGEMYPLLAGTEMLMTRSPLGIVGMIIAKHPETIDGLGKTIVGSGMNVGNVNVLISDSPFRVQPVSVPSSR